MTLPTGFTAAGVASGLKPSGKPDLGVLISDRPAVASGVFTSNRVIAPPTALTKRLIRRGSARAIVVNAGNANACTGRQGLNDAKTMGAATAEQIGVAPKDVLVASTGIIGVPMNMGAALSGIEAAVPAATIDGRDDFARAIMTTDTVPKVAEVPLAGGTVVAVGKGSGMIAPELATMLVFIATDVPIAKGLLDDALVAATRGSFNLLSIDGCMSTNDCVLALANGAAGGDPVDRGDPRAPEVLDAFREVCTSLARQIAEDGEGATKVLSLTVTGATNDREARTAALRIAESVLLRCAVHGGDPNWGRVLAALGTTSIPFDPNLVDVSIGSEKMCAGGMRGPGDEAKAAAAMAGREVQITVDMHRGDAEATVLTNDLSPEYIRINSEYST